MTGPLTPTDRFHKQMRVLDIVTLLPEAEKTLAEYGLHCAHCSLGGVESLKDGCEQHGFDESEIDELVMALNDMLLELPAKDATVTITAPAAREIMKIAETEGRTGQGLSIVLDDRGGFCLEFCEKAGDGDRVFRSVEVPGVWCGVSPLVLRRIGGSVIDFREGKFKLDLSDAKTGCGCKGGGECGCNGSCD